MLRLLNISLVFLVALAGCGKAAKPAVPDLSAYTNIPAGTPVIITLRVQTEGDMPKFARDAFNSVTHRGILGSITPDEVAIHESPTDTQSIVLPKEMVSSIRTNTP